MGRCSYVDKWLEDTDPNGQKYGNWLKNSKKGAGWGHCMFCKKDINIEPGKPNVDQHAKTVKHKKHKTEASSLAVLQPSIQQALGRQEEISQPAKKAKKLEVMLLQSFSRHDIAPSYLECLIPLLKEYAADSHTIKALELGTTKAAYVIKHGIAPAYHDEVSSALRKEVFSLGVDESEINHISELEIGVQYPTELGIEFRHFKTIDLEDGRAETITETVKGAFEDENIDLASSCIGVMSDGCPTMEGKVSGVKQRLTKEIPGFQDLGSCSDHHLNNTEKHAVEAFNKDIKPLFNNLYKEVGGGKSLKSKKRLLKICDEMGVKPVPLPRMTDTRYRHVLKCTKALEVMMPPVLKYLKEIRSFTERQKLIADQILKRDKFLMLELKFLTGSLEFLDRKIDFFERNDVQIHNLYEEMGLILSRQLQIFMKEEVLIEEIDIEGNVIYKKFEELLEIDASDEKNWKPKSEISLGSPAETFLKKLGLTAESPQIQNFFELKVIPFYSKIVQMLQKYFSKGLKSNVLKACSFLSPKKKNNSALFSNLKLLGSKYEKVLKQYSDSTNFRDEFESQVIDYQRLELEPDVLELPFVEFWLAVGQVTVGGERGSLKLLSKFVLALGTQFNSNSKIERQFKKQSSIHSDKHRNSLDQDMLDSYLIIKSGVESLRVVNTCKTCRKDAQKIALGVVKVPRQHCHCLVAKPSDIMLNKCMGARKSYIEDMGEKKKTKETNEEVLAERKKVTEIKINEELEQWKEGLQARSTFLEDETLEIPPLDDKTKNRETNIPKPKKVIKQSSAKTPTSAKNRVAAKALPGERKRSGQDLSDSSVKKRVNRLVEILSETAESEVIVDIGTASKEKTDEEEEASGVHVVEEAPNMEKTGTAPGDGNFRGRVRKKRFKFDV